MRVRVHGRARAPAPACVRVCTPGSVRAQLMQASPRGARSTNFAAVPVTVPSARARLGPMQAEGVKNVP